MALSKSDRLKILTERGHFPAELPPPFNTDNLATYRAFVSQRWEPIATPSNMQFEPFSVPRIGARRRILAIVNPVPQLKLAKLIADEWIQIRSHLKKSEYAIKPVEILPDGDRSVDLPDFNLVDLRKHEVLSRYDDIVISDTSRFYSTIYTHAIAWALHDKKWCKDNYLGKARKSYNASLGARLDKSIRLCQESQSIGIPIGPDTSRIISEIVASSVDQMFCKLSKLSSDQAFRNVDDWFIGHDRNESGENIIANLALSLSHYGLEIHPDKTKVTKAINAPSNLWPSELKRAANYQIENPNRNNLLHFIEKSFDLSKQYSSENVLNFSVKISLNFQINNDQWPVYENFLIRSCRVNTSSIPIVTKLLKEYSDKQYNISKVKISKLISDIILRSAPFSFHFEVAWCLFLAKVLRLPVSPEAAKALGDMESSICALLALDCQASGLITTGLSTAKWRKALSADGLRSNLWLLAYEADLKGWLTTAHPQFVENDPFFGFLKSKCITFYDANRPISVKARKWPTKSHSFDDFLEFLRDTDDEYMYADVDGYGNF